MESLDPEKLSISFTVLGGMEPAERLVGEVWRVFPHAKWVGAE